MRYTVHHKPLSKATESAWVIGIFSEDDLSPSALVVDKLTGGYLRRVLKRQDLGVELGASLLLLDLPQLSASHVLLVRCGKKKTLDTHGYLKVLQKAHSAIARLTAKSVLNTLVELPLKHCDYAWRVKQNLWAWHEATYTFKRRGKGEQPSVTQVTQYVVLASDRQTEGEASCAMAAANAMAAGIKVCKDLGQTPANVCHPRYLAQQARAMAHRYQKIRTTIIDEKRMQALGMGAILAVGQGSAEPPRLIIMQYQGAKKTVAPIALVGKGITYDTGGLSLKPASSMDGMQFDMCGAASVFGALTAVAEMKLPINVVGIIAAAENMPDGKAYRPSDIITTLSGRTIEITNTDAEGRVVLSDALTYAQRYQPETIIDIATLTGAVVVALGSDLSALYSDDQTLANELEVAADQTADWVWRMPIWSPYQAKMDSKRADLVNANVTERTAGSITATCFLSRFTEGQRWAHLDVAGTAFGGAGQNAYATGRPVRLLVQYLMNKAFA